MSQYQIYVHRDNGRQAIITEDNSNTKYKTARLMFLDDKTEKEFSISTIKRWWKKTEETFEYEDTTAIVMQQKKDLGIEVPPIDPTQVEIVEEVAGDETSYKEVMQEILQDEKKAAKKKEQEVQEPKQKKESKKAKKEKRVTFDSTALQEYAIQVVQELGGDYKQRVCNNGSKDMAQKVFRAGGKMFMHMSYPRYYLRMDTRGVDTEKLVPTSELTGFYSARYEFTEDTKQVRSKIKKILTQAYKAQLAKNNKKGKGDK